MGLFDGRIEELGKELADGFAKRANELEGELSKVENDPGTSFRLKVTISILGEVSNVIRNSLTK